MISDHVKETEMPHPAYKQSFTEVYAVVIVYFDHE